MTDAPTSFDDPEMPLAANLLEHLSGKDRRGTGWAAADAAEDGS